MANYYVFDIDARRAQDMARFDRMDQLFARIKESVASITSKIALLYPNTMASEKDSSSVATIKKSKSGNPLLESVIIASEQNTQPLQDVVDRTLDFTKGGTDLIPTVTTDLMD
jgi:hypothetical protein